jgi:hypothetical protein
MRYSKCLTGDDAMPLSLRLDRRTEAIVERLARERGQTKPEVIRDAIHLLTEPSTKGGGPTALDRLRPYAGSIDTDGAALSERTGEKLGALLRERDRARRPR